MKQTAVLSCFAAGLLACAAHAASEAPNVEVVFQDNFDSVVAPGSPPGWSLGKHFGKPSPGAALALDPAPAGHAGSNGLKITSSSGDIPAIALSPRLNIEAGATYRLTADAKGAVDPTRIRMFVVPSDFRGIASIVLPVSSDWQALSLDFKAPAADVKPVNVRFDLMEPGTLWLDNIVLTKTKPGNGTLSSFEEPRPVFTVLDGGMEDAVPGSLPNGWRVEKHYGQIPRGATFGVDNTIAHTGRHSLKVCNPSDEAIPALLVSNPVTVDPGEAYVFTAYLKGDASIGDASLLALRSDFKGADRAPVEVTDTWRRHRLVFTAAQQAEAYMARFDIAPGTVWIDDVAITKLSETDPDAAGPGLGFRHAETTGAGTVTLTVGEPTGHTHPNINGVCYARGFGLKAFPPLWKDANLKVVRLHNVLSHLAILQVDPQTQAQTYDFALLDEAVGQILAAGAVPQMSLCFVPVQMVANPEPQRIREGKYYLGLPDDFKLWEEYVFQVVKHCGETFPRVADWYWIVGNEPGVRQFSVGTKDDFYRLYQHTLAGAVRANPDLQIGAGSFAHFDWLKSFVERCAADGTRLDVLSWHHYDIVPEGYAFRIQRVKDLLARHPGLGTVKLAIDEWNTILPDFRPAEFSAGNHAAAHVVASVATMAKSGLAYQTHFIASSPHGWGMTGAKGIKQPTFNAFELLGRLGARDRELAAPDGEPYVGGIATERPDGTLAVLVWYVKSRNDITPDRDKTVIVCFPDAAPAATVTHSLIDHRHSNSLTDPAHAELETVDAELLPSPAGGAELRWLATPNSVSLLELKPN